MLQYDEESRYSSFELLTSLKNRINNEQYLFKT